MRSLLPDIGFLETLTLSCDLYIFFEVLAGCVKNDVMGFQSFFFKERKAKKMSLINSIKVLKQNYGNNSEQILNTERKLNELVENELRENLAKCKHFDRLNAK